MNRASAGGLLRWMSLLGLMMVLGCGDSATSRPDAALEPLPVCCDDGIDCTRDLCDMASGACSHVPDHSACPEGWQCNPSYGCAEDFPPPEPCDFCIAPRGGWATCAPIDYVCEIGCDAGYVNVEGECQAAGCVSTGTNCDAGTTCGLGACIAERVEALGSATDPITGLPGGGVGVSKTSWRGGYCSPNVGDTGAVVSECDPTDPTDAVCGECGRCVDRGGAGLCLRTCTPHVAGNDECRDGYACSASSGVCLPGCASDAECRVRREESNGVPGIQTPDDCHGDSMRAAASQVCGGVDENFDHLVYDATSSSTCDGSTFRCTNPGTAGASAGIPCTGDRDCEAGGECFEDGSGWPGGYCSKRICDAVRNSCAGAGVCQDRRLDGFACLQGCLVADGSTMADPGSWLTNTGGCREGYACTWDGIHGEGMVNGGCAPGNFGSVATNNVGDACATDADCYSPFGQGVCAQPTADGSGFRDGDCTIMDCQAPGMPSNICGASATCMDVDGPDGDLSACFDTCTDATDCRASYGCMALGGAGSGSVCLPWCTADADCRTAERCSAPTGPELGSCVPR